MPIETLTYAALGARLRISSQAARSLAKRLGLPRSVSEDGKALVSVDLAEIREDYPSLGEHDLQFAATRAKAKPRPGLSRKELDIRRRGSFEGEATLLPRRVSRPRKAEVIARRKRYGPVGDSD